MSGPEVSIRKINEREFLREGVINTQDSDSYYYVIENVTLDKTGVIDVPALVKNVSVPGNNKKVPTIIYLSKKAAKNIRDVKSDTLVYLKVEGNVSLFNFKGNARIVGGPEDNTFTGNANHNALYGGGGDDVLEGLGGADELYGGRGHDTANYESSPAGVLVNLNTGVGSDGDAQGDKLFSVENVIGSSSDDTLIGNASYNTLVGSSGKDTLIGNSSDDVLVGSSGNDVFLFDVNNDNNIVFGGVGGTDQLDLSGVKNPSDWTLDLVNGSIVSQDEDFIKLSRDASGTLTYNDKTTTIVFSEIEKISWYGLKVNGISGNNSFIGGRSNDVLVGNEGNNELRGLAGDDTLKGLGGDDTLIGSQGDDTYVIDKNWEIATIIDDGGQVVFHKDFDLETTTFIRRNQDLVIKKGPNTNGKITIDFFFDNKDTFSFACGNKKYDLGLTDSQYKFMLVN